MNVNEDYTHYRGMRLVVRGLLTAAYGLPIRGLAHKPSVDAVGARMQPSGASPQAQARQLILIPRPFVRVQKVVIHTAATIYVSGLSVCDSLTV